MLIWIIRRGCCSMVDKKKVEFKCNHCDGKLKIDRDLNVFVCIKCGCHFRLVMVKYDKKCFITRYKQELKSKPKKEDVKHERKHRKKNLRKPIQED